MGSCVDSMVLAVTILTIVSNIVGMGIPVWYRKYHNHSVANQTEPTNPKCHVSVKIQEGLWQRYCEQETGKDCIVDFEEWCDNLDYPEVTNYVIMVEIWGDLFVIFAAVTIIRSKYRSKEFKIEMVGAECGLGGILMLVGVMVYAYGDSEVGYTTLDLHAGWGLCFGSGCVAIFVFIYCLYLDIKKSRRHIPYFPIDNDSIMHSDEELLEV